MSFITYILVLLLAACSIAALVNAGAVDESERAGLISEAIKEVKSYERMAKMNSAEKKATGAQKKLHGFKMATPASLAQGNARLRFERMLRAAEKKILKSQRKVSVQDSSARAESLAFELLHKLGQLLSAQEIARIYSESGCREAVTSVPFMCSSVAQRSFRTADGTCNNLQRPTLGAASTGLRRLLSARYDDGIMRARGFLQSTGSSLFIGPFAPPIPSSRIASTEIVRDRLLNDTAHTHMLMQWGQFLDHDLDAVPEHEPEECPEGCQITKEEEGSCYPIVVPEDDDQVMVTRTSPDARQCHPFRRSLAVCVSEGEMNMTGDVPPREQINSITHFIDGSMVYHHDPDIQRTLIRNTTNDAGLLNVGLPVAGTTQDTLPIIDTVAHPGIVACPNPPCFLAGDFRVNEQAALTVMHTIWLREHNRIARAILQMNPYMSGTKVFLVTRSIVGGMIQKITYKDFLPEIFGDLFTTLIPSYSGYDPTVDPNVPNAFATAAYRFGHSMIQPFFERLNEQYESIPAGPLPLVEAFFNAAPFIDNLGTDPMLRGLLEKNARQVDEFLNFVLTNRLFADGANIPGLDLASLNVQRGRDHGLPTYLVWKQWAKKLCVLESDFRNELTEVRFLQTYGSLDNVDLFIGGLAEKPIPGGIVGAVFSCIFSKTFTALRNGDRFYYENVGSVGLFTQAQLAEIEKASLSRVICDNSDGITEIQPNAFLASQSRVPCLQIPSVDLSAWRVSSESCLMRVVSDTSRSFYAVSRIGGRLHYSLREASLNQPSCIHFECPTATARSNVALSLIPRARNCRLEVNQGLPASSRSSFYLSALSTSHLQASNGIHQSLDECNVGSAVALRYVCSGTSTTLQTTAKSEEASDNDVDIDTDDVNELTPLFNEEDKEILDAVNTDEPVSENKLIALMEDVLAQLQETKEEKKAKATDTEDRALLSKLEKLLKVN